MAEELQISAVRGRGQSVQDLSRRLRQAGKVPRPDRPLPFFGASETDFGLHQKASDGEYAVFDLMPNAREFFRIWENNPQRVNLDYYITADGKSGIVVRHVNAGAPYCIWYSHWQGLNPGKNVGWSAFTTVVARIRRHLNDPVVRMRPSEIADRCCEAGGCGLLTDGRRSGRPFATVCGNGLFRFGPAPP